MYERGNWMKKKITKRVLSAVLATIIAGTSASFPTFAADGVGGAFPTAISFEDGEDLNYVVGGDAVRTSVTTGATDGTKALQCVYPEADWPGMNLRPKDIDGDNRNNFV